MPVGSDCTGMAFVPLSRVVDLTPLPLFPSREGGGRRGESSPHPDPLGEGRGEGWTRVFSYDELPIPGRTRLARARRAAMTARAAVGPGARGYGTTCATP